MRSFIRLCFWALSIAIGLGGAAIAADPETTPVVVTLRTSAGVTESPVCIGHVASVSGGTAVLREQIGRLDLADRPKAGKSLSVLRELVTYRIQVAGVERDRFRVQGAAVVQVTPGPLAMTEEDFLQVAREALLGKLSLPPDDVTVALAALPSLPQLTLSARDEVRLQAVPQEPINVPGRLRVDVTVLVNGDRIEVVPVLLDVKVYESVAVAERRIESGEMLIEENVRFERRAVEAAGSCLNPKDVKAGQKARRALAAGQVILRSTVEPVHPENPILVRQRELVKLVARVGKLSVTAIGEAQQDGHDGERIRVRNVDSKKELVGRIIGRGLVEVEY